MSAVTALALDTATALALFHLLLFNALSMAYNANNWTVSLDRAGAPMPGTDAGKLDLLEGTGPLLVSHDHFIAKTCDKMVDNSGAQVRTSHHLAEYLIMPSLLWHNDFLGATVTCCFALKPAFFTAFFRKLVEGGCDLTPNDDPAYVCMVCVGGSDPTRATQPSLGLLSRAMVVPPHCARPGVPPPPPQGGPLCARALVAESRGGGASPLRAPRIGRFRGQGLGPDRRSSATTATRKRIAPQRCAAAG